MGIYDTDDDDVYTPSPDTSEDTATPPDDATTAQARTVVRGGWANARTQKEAASPFPQRLAPTPEGLVLKFLEDGPYTTYRQHWVQEIKEGSKAFPCLDGIDPKGCPLCDAKNRASPQFHFNVALLDKSEPATLKSYNVGPTIFDQLSGFHDDARQGPLNKHYWVAKRVKNGQKWSSTFFMQRKEDLVEQGYKNIPSTEDLAAFTLWDEATIRFSSYKELAEVAALYLDLE
jgi:hypothetical protein